MTRAEQVARMLAELRVLDERHNDDRDGGYAFVEDLARYRRQTTPVDREVLDELLAEMVLRRRARLAGAALELIARENIETTVPTLYRALDESSEPEWANQIVLALLRMHQIRDKARLVRYVEAALSERGDQALPLVAALCYSDSYQSIKLASSFFAQQLRNTATAERLQGYIPAFVRSYASVEPRLLSDLVQATSTNDEQAGQLLKGLVMRCLQRPWIVSDIGDLRNLLDDE